MPDDTIPDSVLDGRPSGTRRHILKAVGLTGATGFVAGCSGGDGSDGSDGGDGNGSDGGDGGGTVDATLKIIEESVPTSLQFNPYNPNNQAGWLFEDLGSYSPQETKYRGVLASDWTVEGTEMTITLNENQKWHNGDEVLAEDLVTKVKIEKYFDNQVWTWLDSVEATGDKKTTFTFKNDINPDVAKASLIHGFTLDTPRSQYSSYLQSLEEASSSDEEDKALQELTQFAPKVGDAVGNTPWRVETADKNRVDLEIWDGHPASDDLNFRDVKMPYITSENKVKGIQSGQVDYVNADTIGPDLQGQLQDVILRFAPGYGGVSVSVNHNDDILGRRKVRQALAYVLNGNKILANPLRGTADALAVGLPLNISGDVSAVLPNIHDKITTYETNEQNLQKAEQLLKDEGFTKDGDKWMTPGGKRFVIKGPWPSAGPNPSRVQTMNRQLSEFGINGQIQVIETSTWGNRLTNCNYKWTHGYWGGVDSYNSFRNGFILAANPRPTCSENPKETYEVPWPPGDPEGSLQEINVYDRINQIPEATGDQATKLVEELAWTYNQALPQLPVLETNLPMAFRTDTFEWPAEDSPLWKLSYPPHMIPSLGEVKAKE